MTKTQNFFNRLTSTLWFIPAMLALAGGLLGLLMVAFDYYVSARLGYFPRFFDVQPSGARDMLAVVAGSMITVAGTVFSITIVALSLASTQFSPRILRNFMRDAGNQFVLGAFAGIFAYCIVVLRTIREGTDEAGSFVPSLAVAFGILLALAGIGFLIYFIHHVATTIQATSIIEQIAAETVAEIEENFSFEYDARMYDENLVRQIAADSWLIVPAAATGYIQNADATALAALAEKSGFVAQMRRGVGEFTIKGLPLMEIAPENANFALDEKLVAAINDAYSIGSYRTVEGDVAFGIRQIVDIALKALSPAINDTTTALSCIDYATAILVCLAQRPSCPPLRFAADGKLRIIIKEQRFEDFFDLAFNQIRQNAAGNVAVILRLLNSIEVLGEINQNFVYESERIERHNLLETQARLIAKMAERTIPADTDLTAVQRRFAQIEKMLETLR